MEPRGGIWSDFKDLNGCFSANKHNLVSQSCSALCATSLEYFSAVSCSHSLSEAVLLLSLALFGLICSKHIRTSLQVYGKIIIFVFCRDRCPITHRHPLLYIPYPLFVKSFFKTICFYGHIISQKQGFFAYFLVFRLFFARFLSLQDTKYCFHSRIFRPRFPQSTQLQAFRTREKRSFRYP